MASSTCRAWRIVLPYEDRLWSLPASPQQPFGNRRFHSFSIRFPFVSAGEVTLKVARPRPSARDLAKLCPRPLVLWKSLWKLRWRRLPWKHLGRAFLQASAGSVHWWPRHFFPCTRLFCIFKDTKKIQETIGRNQFHSVSRLCCVPCMLFRQCLLQVAVSPVQTTLEILTQTQVDMESNLLYTRCLEAWTVFKVVSFLPAIYRDKSWQNR